MMIITRQQYFKNLEACKDDWEARDLVYREYYAQFVTDEIKALVEETFGITNLCKCFSKDKHLNNIPLVEWDRLGLNLMHGSRYLNRELIKETRQGYSNASAVCILKEAARQLIEEYSSKSK